MGLVIELHFISSILPETKTAHVVSAVWTIDISGYSPEVLLDAS